MRRLRLAVAHAPLYSCARSRFKFNDKDPKSEFVLQRRSNLETYFKKLFETHPSLPFDPLVWNFLPRVHAPPTHLLHTTLRLQVMAFFQLEELSMEAAIATSRKTQK